MKLVTKIILGLSAAVLVILSLWGAVFYFSLVHQLNLDLNETLTSYSRDIIVDHLYGYQDDEQTDAVTVYNSIMREVTEDYALAHSSIGYWDSETYIPSQDDVVPSRSRRCVFRDSEDRYFELIVSVPTFERDSVFGHVMKLTALLYVLLLLTIIATSLVVIRFNLRPLESLIRWFEHYRESQNTPPPPVETGVVEFARLSKVAAEAVKQLEERNEEQQSFVGNVSHELQTPLSVCIGRVEMLMADPSLTESQAVELSRLNRSLMETSRLNKTLLTLYRVDNLQFPQTETVDFSSLVGEALELYSEIYAGRGVTAEFDGTAPFVREINPELARSLVNNLVKNAFIHSDHGARVSVSMSPDGFAVSNDGTEPLDGSKVFSRFYRSSSDKSGSTGLGLALAASICRTSGLTLNYSFASFRHTFSVTRRKC